MSNALSLQGRDIVNEFLLLTKTPRMSYGPGLDMLFNRPALVLTDKLTLSVQASDFHYCIPKGSNGPYTHVEVCAVTGGTPRIIKRYCGDSRYRSVYGYIPVEVINYVIAKHGGIKELAR